eukprot:gene5350-5886_t
MEKAPPVVVGRRPKSTAHPSESSKTGKDNNNKEGGGYNPHTKRLCANPLDRLCDHLLDWNLTTDLKEQLQNRKSVDDLSSSTTGQEDSLPSAFSCFHEYISLWEPLLLTEMKANVVTNFRSKSMQSLKKGLLQFTLSDHISSVSHEIQCLVSSERPGGGGEHDPSAVPSVMDVLLLSPRQLDPPLLSWADQPAMLGLVVGVNFTSGTRLLQVKVNSKKWFGIRQQTRVISSSAVNVNASSSSSSGQLLSNNANATTQSTTFAKVVGHTNGSKATTYRLHYTIVENIRSNWREYQAVHELGTNIPLMQDILAANKAIDMAPTPPSSPQTAGNSRHHHMVIETEGPEITGLSANFISHLKNTFNPSQFRAISTAAASQGFTLIQGPPGTGKTSTIIGLLNALHMREYNQYYDHLLKVFLGPQGLACRAKGDEHSWLQLLAHLNKNKPRILIVAPSNVAVDNIILRILENKFLDGSGNRYSPSIVRVGAGRTSQVSSVALEVLVEAELCLGQTIDQKKDRLQDLHNEIRQRLKEIVNLQTMLINMKTAFERHNPLPEGWELRISSDTAQPYWVDHSNRMTSLVPPPVVINGRGGGGGYRSLRQLPEYRIFSHRFTHLLSQLENLQLKRSRLTAVVDPLNTGRRDPNFIPASTRDLVETSIIDEAQLLFTTLNSCGHPSMESTEFCLSVIDEAAQCVEPSTLIPLRRGCKQCVMVGDQKQLPATVFSESVRRKGYDRSLFERLIETGHDYIMLDTQYRMTPLLSRFPSRAFYSGRLRDGDNVINAAYLPPWIASSAEQFISQQGKCNDRDMLMSLLFFDLRYSSDQESQSSLSKINLFEVRFCMTLLQYLARLLHDHNADNLSIGVITPYADQLQELQKAYRKKMNSLRSLLPQDVINTNLAGVLNVDFNTVDGFQGREKDIVIISAVRANDQHSIGFLSDMRRMNVAITRARYALFVLGQSHTLSADPMWLAFLDHCRHSQVLRPISRENPNISLADVFAGKQVEELEDRNNSSSRRRGDAQHNDRYSRGQKRSYDRRDDRRSSSSSSHSIPPPPPPPPLPPRLVVPHHHRGDQEGNGKRRRVVDHSASEEGEIPE